MPRKDLPRHAAKILALLTGLALLLVQLPASGAASDAIAGRSALDETGSPSKARRAENWFVLDPVPASYAESLDLSRAKPISWTPDIGALSRSLTAAPEVQAPPVSIAPRAPSTTEKSQLSRSIRPSFQTHIPFTRTEIPDPTVYPFVIQGKVFLDHGNALGLCSGTVVTSNNQSVVMTAAHCLVDPVTGATPQAIAFAPGYQLNNAPFGLWEADAFGVTLEWANSAGSPAGADPRYDIGAFVVGRDANDQAIGDLLGTRGITFNQPPFQLFDSFGYPAAAPFDGERLFLCDSSTSDLSDLFPAPQPHGIGCDMTPGSSGGGWILNDSFVNSVNSFKLVDHPNVMYGPQFGTSAQDLYNLASDYDGSEPPPDPTTHRMTVGINLSGHLVISGTMRAKDGYKPCTRGAPIKIFKKKLSSSKRPRGGRLVRKAETNFQGKFRAGNVPDKPGYYYVKSPAGSVDDANLCSATKSAVKAHRH
jgi:V8-like Glu-specific endopeptidase